MGQSFVFCDHVYSCACAIPSPSIASTQQNGTINFILSAGFCVPHKLFQQTVSCFNFCSTRHDLSQSTLYHIFFKVISNTTVPYLFTCTTKYLLYFTVSLMVYYNFSSLFNSVHFTTILFTCTIQYLQFLTVCVMVSHKSQVATISLVLYELYSSLYHFYTTECPQLLTVFHVSSQ